MSEIKEQNQSWWATLPGIITGIATLITAIGSLIIVLNTNKPSGLTSTHDSHDSPFVSDNKSSTPGRFPRSSDIFLTLDDVSKLSKADLKLMRNEIYARHGYLFKTEEMKAYFKYQTWYSPRYDDVTSFLTEKEKANINLIKSNE